MPGPKVVKVAVSDQLWDRIVAAAAAREQTVSEFIRSAIRVQLSESDVRTLDAQHAVDLIRAVATAAQKPQAAGQDAPAHELKGAE